jgi:hypothetical protein
LRKGGKELNNKLGEGRNIKWEVEEGDKKKEGLHH